jgi:hypothetical protein
MPSAGIPEDDILQRNYQILRLIVVFIVLIFMVHFTECHYHKSQQAMNPVITEERC